MLAVVLAMKRFPTVIRLASQAVRLSARPSNLVLAGSSEGVAASSPPQGGSQPPARRRGDSISNLHRRVDKCVNDLDLPEDPELCRKMLKWIALRFKERRGVTLADGQPPQASKDERHERQLRCRHPPPLARPWLHGPVRRRNRSRRWRHRHPAMLQ